MKQTSGDFPRLGEIYWISFDPSVGTEIQKTRPAVVISNNLFNKNLTRVIVAPITSNVKKIFDFDCAVAVEGEKGKIMLDQLRTVDKSRLFQKIGTIDIETMASLKKALKITFNLS